MTTPAETLAAAIQQYQAGDLARAEELCRHVLEFDPNQVDALYLFGLLAGQRGRHEAAVEHIERAIDAGGRHAVIYNALGTACAALRRTAEAVAAFRRAVELAPDLAEAHNNLGNARTEQGELEQAIACYRRAIALQPDNAAAHNNLGLAWMESGAWREAMASFQDALTLQAGFAEPWNNLGLVWLRQGNLDEAMRCYRQALELAPVNANAHTNLGLAYALRGNLEGAIACYQQAIRIRPDHAEAHFCQGCVWLLQGDFQRGWPEYEWRRRMKECRDQRRFPQPVWDGSPLEGRTILLTTEQGLGDTIQFIRFAAEAKRAGGMVMVECQESLIQLLRSCQGIDRLVAQGSPLPPFDVHAPLLSLPGILKTRVETIPAEVPYLTADRPLVEFWREKLARLEGFRVGIAWQGSPAFRHDRFRSIPLAEFAPLTDVPGVSLVSLQKGFGTEQIAAVSQRFRVTELGPIDEQSGAFMDTAAILMNLDLVITSDTVMAHLAGALGLPVWVALPLAPDWRWLLDREDSPWYPTMRLFRQTSLGDWGGVFRRMKEALGELIEGPQGQPLRLPGDGTPRRAW